MYEWIVDGISSLFAPHAELSSARCSKGDRGPLLSTAASPGARRQETPSRPAKRNYESVHSPDLKPEHREVKRPRKDVVVNFVKKTFSGVTGLLRLQNRFTAPSESQSACLSDQVPAEELLGVDEIQGNNLNKWISCMEMKMEKPKEVRYNGKVGSLVKKPNGTGMYLERTKSTDHRRSLQLLSHRSTLKGTTPYSVDSPAVLTANRSQKPCLTVEEALKHNGREQYRLLVEMVSEKYTKNKPLPLVHTRPPTACVRKPLLPEVHRPAFFSRTREVITNKAGPVKANASGPFWQGASSARLCKNGKEKAEPPSVKGMKNGDQGAVCVQAEDTLARQRERLFNAESLSDAIKHEDAAWKQPVEVDLSAEVAARLNLVDCESVAHTHPAIKAQQPVPESCSSSKEFPRLTQEMQQEINQALAQKDPDLVLSSAFKLRITQRDLATLQDGGWLNDEVINFYMNLLMCRSEQGRGRKVYAFSTFFFPKLHGGGHTAVRRWTKVVDLFEYEIIVVPLHLGVHWSLAVIDFNTKSVMYYDSMGQRHDDICKLLLLYLKEELKAKKNKDLDVSRWVAASLNAKEIPQQNNGSDCGVFACKYADYVSQGRPLTFTQSHVPYFRRRMIWEILNQRLL